MANEINIGINTTSDLSGLNQVDESVKSLKTQLKEAQANVAALSDKFGATSKEAVEAAKSAAILKDKIGDSKALTDAFNPDAKFKAVSASLAGVAGGFSAVQGAMGLFGEESKDVEKAILKVQSAMALASGIQAIGESADAFKNMKTVAVDAFRAIKGAIGATGIGLLVVALGTIYAYWDDIKEAVSGVSEEQKKLNAASKKNVELEAEKLKKLNLQENELKFQGKSEKEILNLKIKQTEAQIKATEINIKNQEITNKLAVEGAKRNYQMLKSYLDFISMPLKFLYENAASAINGIIKLINKIGIVKIDVQLDENLVDKTQEYLQKLVFDPEETKKEGEKLIKESKESLDKLKSDYFGFKNTLRDIDKKAGDEAAQKRKQEQEKREEERLKEEQKLKDQAEKDKNILNQSIKEREDMEADSATKKAILQHTRRLEEINQIKDFNSQKAALEEEEKVNSKRMADAMQADKEAEYNKSVEFMNLEDGNYESSLQKQLEHYEHLKTIQIDYGKSTIEIDKQIKKTKEQIAEDNYNKAVAIIKQENNNNLDQQNNVLKHYQDLETKLKASGESTVAIQKEIAEQEKLIEKTKQEYKEFSVNKGIEVAGQAGQLLQQIAGNSKEAAIGGIVLEKAASIASIIASTFATNAKFTGHPASILSFGGAAALPVALNTASGAIGIASIIAQASKSISEINGTKSQAEAAKPTPSKFATGGLVTGMGTSTSDSIIANLSNGESVINAKSTAMFGNLLSNINQAGGGVAFGNQNNANPIFKTYVVASEMTSQIEANLKLKQIARL